MTRLAAVLAASTAVAFTVVGFLAAGFSAITGSPVFLHVFWVVLRGALLGLGALAAFAGLVLAAVWLLLSSRSPIPAVRSHWAHRLAPACGRKS